MESQSTPAKILFGVPTLLKSATVCTVRILLHKVTIVVVCCTGTATATAVIELALGTSALVSLCTQLLEDFGIRPDFVERSVVNIARFFHHVGARANLADRAYDAVVEASEATAAVTCLDIELVCNAEELRSACGLHWNSERAALSIILRRSPSYSATRSACPSISLPRPTGIKKKI